MRLVDDDRALALRSGEDVLEVGDLQLEGLGLLVDLLALEGGQTTQLEFEDRACLDLVDGEQLHQAVAGLLDVGRPADERDDLVEGVERGQVAAQDVRTLLGFAQTELGAADDDLDLVVDPRADEAVERQGAGHPVDDGEHVRAEVLLQLGVLVQVVEHDLGDRVTLQHDDQALPGTTRGLVADVGDAGETAVLDEARRS